LSGRRGGKQGGSRKLRVIGGEWRGRVLTFPDHPGIRPTPDRVRETLFNWLQPTIHGARCLDLFAGSGALGLEALSRGAAHVDFVERDRKSGQAIQEHLKLLKSDRGIVHLRDGLRLLDQLELSDYQLIFLDPPFGKGLLQQVVARLEKSELHPALQLYIEVERDMGEVSLPQRWQVVRSGEAGQVRYLLAENVESSAS